MPLSANLRPYDKDDGQAGMLAQPAGSFATDLSVTAQQVYLGRFVPSRPIAVTVAAFSVRAADSADNSIEIGIYDSALARVATSGLVAGKLNAGTGPKTVTLSYTLLPGVVYYSALLVPTITTSLQVGGFSFTSSLHTRMFGENAPQVSVLAKTGQTGLPSTISSPSNSGLCGLVAFRES